MYRRKLNNQRIHFMSNKYITLTVKVIVDEDNVQDIEEWVNERLSNDARFDLVEVDKEE